MKRILLATMMVGLVGFVGCSDTSKVEEKHEVSTPGGKTTERTTTEVQQSGQNPPPADTTTPPPPKTP